MAKPQNCSKHNGFLVIFRFTERLKKKRWMWQVSADQRGRLLMSTERLNKSTDRVRDSRRIMLETEELGVSLLQDLHQQRESLLRAHGTVLFHFSKLQNAPVLSPFYRFSHLPLFSLLTKPSYLFSLPFRKKVFCAFMYKKNV